MFLGSVAGFLGAAVGAAAHGFVQYITADGRQYKGYDPGFRFQSPPPRVPGWYADNADIGFVAPQSFANPNITCHKAATPGQEHVQVQAGSTVTVQWFTWPESHVGPIMDYLAPCPVAGCAGVDKNELRFVKVAQQALKPGVASSTDWLKAWVVDDFRKNSYRWEVRIPADLAPGGYVLRHEILALHSAWDVNGAQAYPQCINLNITNGGNTTITGGAPPTSFYRADDAGVHFSVYNGLTTYPFPGPQLWR